MAKTKVIYCECKESFGHDAGWTEESNFKKLLIICNKCEKEVNPKDCREIEGAIWKRQK